jgi:hypothetical protein
MVSYIKPAQTDLGAKSSDPKALLFNNLPPEAPFRYIRPQASNPKCNAQFAHARLSPTKSTDSILTFFTFLSPAYNSLHCNQPFRLENETGVPAESTFNHSPVNKMHFHFSPELSQNVLFFPCRSSFFWTNEGFEHTTAACIRRMCHFLEKLTAPKTINFTHASPT